MKCLIIFNSKDLDLLYVEHSEIDLLTQKMFTTVEFIKGNIGQRPQYISAGKQQFVFHYNDSINIWFVLMSDDDDSETLLRYRLNLLNNLYSMIIGNIGANRRAVLKKKMTQISATVNALFDESQSVLCQAYEILELNDKLRQRCYKEILELMDQFSKSVYAIIFVGQKLATFHCKQKPHLHSSDIFLLSLYCQIQLKTRQPIIYNNNSNNNNNNNNNNVENSGNVTPKSVATEDSFENVSPRNNLDDFSSPCNVVEDGLSSEDERFDTAPEEFDENSQSSQKSFLYSVLDEISTSISSSSSPQMMPKIMKQKLANEFLKEGVKQSSHSDLISLLNYILLAIGSLDESADRNLYTTQTQDAIKKLQAANSLPDTGEADPTTIRLILSKGPVGNVPSLHPSFYAKRKKSQPAPVEDMDSGFKEINLDSRKDSSRGGSSNTTPSIANSLKFDNSQEDEYTPSKSTLEVIYNSKLTPIWAYCAEIQKNCFLVLLSKDLHTDKVLPNEKKDLAAEMELLEKSKPFLYDKLFKQLGQFLFTKEMSNLGYIRFSHIPGLVHFILLDRTYNRIKAPSINLLNGKKYPPTENMIELIRKQVWSMYSTCVHQLVKKGYTHQIIRDKNFMYSYRLWVEDDEGQDTTHAEIFSNSRHDRVYQEVIKRYYPHPVKCMELLTLYIGSVPMSLIFKNDKILHTLLFDIVE